jgi:hypothetical protein
MMENFWSYDVTEKVRASNRPMIEGAYEEKDRRMRAVAIVRMFKKRIDQTCGPMEAKDLLSALFRQRGIPSLDEFTKMLITSFRAGLDCEGEAEGTLRKILSIGRWRSTNSCVTAWMVEPVVSTTLIKGNSLSIPVLPLVDSIESMSVRVSLHIDGGFV